MINDLASRHGIGLEEAKEFLKANKYDPSLLDWNICKIKNF